ncbi:hypothetical protein F5Y15DRAFT_242014 [Xylariaceae sp. FL0016]|nr:hypothetical protein F5Y15DRAFT_242014 [Xylariaceae sp. FL0016]
MNTLLETGDSRRRQSRLMEQQGRDRARALTAWPGASRYTEPRSIPPVPAQGTAEHRHSGVSAQKNKHKRHSRIGRIVHRHHHKKPVMVMVVQPDQKDFYSNDKAAKEKDMAGWEDVALAKKDQRGDAPPAYAQDDIMRLTNDMQDLEAQRERVETRRFWILALPTVIGGICTIVIMFMEILDYALEAQAQARELGGE